MSQTLQSSLEPGLIKPSSQAKALVPRSGKPFPCTVRESRPSQRPPIRWPDFTPPFHPPWWHGERRRLLAKEPHEGLTAARPHQPRAHHPSQSLHHTMHPQILPALLSCHARPGKARPGPQLQVSANVRLGNSREGWPSNFHRLKTPRVSTTFQFTLQTRTSLHAT